jgi:RarD protein
MHYAKERFKFITAATLYGTKGMFLRFVDLPSEAVAFYRGVIGAVFILLYRFARKERPELTAIRKNLVWLLLSGMALGLNWIFLFAAYVNTTVAIASLCNYMAPILVLIAAPLLLREKLVRRKLPCVAAALLGIVLVSGVLSGGGGETAGVALGLAAALCFTGIVICNRKLRGISAYDRSVVQLAVSAVTILPYVLARNLGTPLELNTRAVLIVLLLGVVHTGFAYCLYFSGMGTLPVQTVALLGYLEPVVSVLCSVFFMGEALSVWGWIGVALILAAAVVSELMPEEKASR